MAGVHKQEWLVGSLRRRLSSLLVTTTLAAAALSPGAAVFASTEQSPECVAPRQSLSEAVKAAAVIVVGRVGPGRPDGTADLAPERFLKGAVSGGSLRLSPSSAGNCAAPIPSPGRVVLFLDEDLAWPGADDAFVLRDARAFSLVDGDIGSESSFLDDIQDLTGQSAVPAQTNEEGEGIEWGTTVLPIAAALGIVFIIGLFLMRIWHRIDPS